MSNISNLVHSVRDIMRKDAGVDGDAQRISQLVWMIFLKVFDSMEEEKEAENPKYKSPIPEEIRWRNWAADPEGITGEELLDFVNNKVFKELKNLSLNDKSDPRGFIVKGVFEDAYNYMKNGVLIRQVINKINEIDFTSSEERHLFNDIYEGILRELQSAGSAGEFYTPRPVTQFIVDMVNPKIGEKILDPACGTGGFLVSVLNHLKHKIKSVEDQEKVQNNLFGIDKKQLPHLLCMTNLILHDIEIPKIKHDNSLAKPLVDYTSKDMVDVVVTNPPFGGAEEEGIENYFPAEFRTRETADLFLILIMKLLRDGGRCGIVLPDGFLFGEGVKTRIKEKLLSEFNLHTIVRLPNGVFSPYTGIRTNLLFFEKDSRGTKEIWYFEHPLPENYKIYNKTKPIRHEEFELEKGWWKDRDNPKFKQYAWKVSKDEILKRNFNLDIKNPYKENSDYESSKEILKRYEKVKADLEKYENTIKKELVQFFDNDDNPLLQNLEFFFNKEDSATKIKEAIFLSIFENLLKKFKTKPISEVFKTSSGGTPSRFKSEYWEGNIPWLSSGELKDSKIKDSREKITEQGLKNSSTKLFPKNTALIAITGATTGETGLLEIDACTNQSVVGLYPNKENKPEFVWFYLMSRYYFFRNQTLGSAQPHINKGIIDKAKYPLVPVNKQEEIVKIIEKFIKLCKEIEDKIKENKKNAEKLMETVLKESFEK